MAKNDEQVVGLVRCFKVSVDGENLGFWTKCEGLAVEYEVFEYQEGGVNDHVHRLPGRRKYQNLKLTRPLDKDSDKVKDWLTKMLPPTKPATAVVTVLDSGGERIHYWEFVEVFPVKWSGPALDAGGNLVATETLELAHGGFLKPG